MASGKQQWGGLFKIVSRAYLKELAEAEAEKPDRYVYKPAMGKETVEINDFESTALDFYECALDTCSCYGAAVSTVVLQQ